MKRAAFLAAVITTLLTTAAYAATWEIVPGLKNEYFIHYVDTESISGTPPGPVEAWKMVKNNLSDPTTRSGYCDYPSKDPNSKCTLNLRATNEKRLRVRIYQSLRRMRHFTHWVNAKFCRLPHRGSGKW